MKKESITRKFNFGKANSIYSILRQEINKLGWDRDGITINSNVFRCNTKIDNENNSIMLEFPTYFGVILLNFSTSTAFIKCEVEYPEQLGSSVTGHMQTPFMLLNELLNQVEKRFE